MLSFYSRHLTRSATAFCAAAILAFAAANAWAWQTAHGDPDNSGMVDVPTAWAAKPLTDIGLDYMAPGAGPVIAPDGTLYVGNLRGRLMSFRPDGTPGWTRDLGGFQSILASPALGSDGSIYVIGSATVRDQTTSPATIRHSAELHKFTVGGGWLWHRPIPGVDAALVLSAPPNILRVDGRDIVLLPTGATFQARLTAFSGDTGAVLAHQTVTHMVPETTGGASWSDLVCYLVQIGGACGFENTIGGDPRPQDRLPDKLKRPFPGVAIHTPAQGGAPLILVSDGFQDLVGYSFTGSAFEERFRVHDDKRYVTATPLAWPDGHAMISMGGFDTKPEVMYAGPGFSTIRAAGPFTYAAPTALGNSRHALVHRYGGVTIMSGVTTQAQVTLPGESIASAAASRNHLFVSTASALYTFDKATMKQLAEFQWSKGGTSQPVIGPHGHVYAVAGDTLFVFPPPIPALSDGRIPDVGTLPVIQQASPEAPSGIQQDVSAQAYKPPLTPGGNRLFACLQLDGDDCGKAQHREIAAAFCRAQGFDRAENIDVDSRRVTAETLQGQLCSKKKCKVFDRIICRK